MALWYELENVVISWSKVNTRHWNALNMRNIQFIKFSLVLTPIHVLLVFIIAQRVSFNIIWHCFAFSAPLLFSCRFTLSIMGFFAMFFLLLLRINISLTLVCMVRSKALSSAEGNLTASKLNETFRHVGNASNGFFYNNSRNNTFHSAKPFPKINQEVGFANIFMIQWIIIFSN